MINKDKLVGIIKKATEWCLYLMIFFLPFSKSMIEITIGASFILWIFKKIITKDLSVKRTPLNGLLLFFFIANVLSLINGWAGPLALKWLVSKCVKYIILFFIVIETLDSEERLLNMIKIAFLSAIIVIIDSYIQYYITHVDIIRLYPSFKYAPITDPSGFLGFPTGPFPFPNDLSAWLLMVLFPALSVFLWHTKTLNSKFALGSFVIFSAFLLYLANTRSAWIGFFVSFFAVILVQNGLKVVAILLIIAFVATPFLLKERTDNIFGLSSLRDRFSMWRVGWNIFREHPIIGNGLNTFFTKFRDFREDEFKYKKGSYAHNAYLQIAADLGLVGLFAFLALIARSFLVILAYVKNAKDCFYKYFTLGLTSATLAFLTHSFFDTNLQSLPLVTLFWFSLSVLMSIVHIETSKINEKKI